MPDDKQLALREDQPIQTIEDRKRATDQIIEMSTYWAKKLMEVVEQCGLARSMGGKKYLEVEGWQVIGEFAHVRPVIAWVRPWFESEQLIGYEARCDLYDDENRIVGSGESSCGLDAFPCRGKQGSEKDKAAKSAAQTWAISRALRNKFSYVAKIGGYQAVPAEEMPRDEEPRQSTAEKLITTKSTFVPKMNSAQLGLKIMDFVNNDSQQAKEILKSICGKTTCAGMTPAEVSTVYGIFERDYLSRQPGDDDQIPEFDVPKSMEPLPK